MKPDFSQLRSQPTSPAQLDAAYEVLKRVGKWLERKGRRQRIGLTTRETYESWQAAGWNHVVMHGRAIAGVFSLCHEVLSDWQGTAPAHPVPFLRALATDPDWRGHSVGTFGITSALKLAAPREVWLDCVSDFLPQYYSRQGFQRLGQRTILTNGHQYDVCLMCSKSNRD